MSLLRRHLPALAFAALILSMSGSRGSATATGSWAEPLMLWLGFPEDLAWGVHRAFRKLGHLTAYGIFGVLALRSVDGARPPTGRTRALAIGLALALAVADETTQALYSDRGGSALDVLLDVTGAALAVGVIQPALARRRAKAATP